MTDFITPEECRAAGVTYHLVPSEHWAAHESGESYLPEHFDADGFIHCTNGTSKLVDVANLFYTADARQFMVLALKVDAIDSPVRYDDPDEFFPHIYGPLNTDAVIGTLVVTRDQNGKFVRIASA